MTITGIVIALALSASTADEAAQKKFNDESFELDHAVAKQVREGEYAAAAKAVRAFADANAHPPEDLKHVVEGYRSEASELEGWAKLAAQKDAASLKTLVAALAHPESGELQQARALEAQALPLLKAARDADPALKALLSRPVKVSAHTQDWPSELGQVLVDRTVDDLKKAGVPASSTTGKDELRLQAGGCASETAKPSYLAGVAGCRIQASARWLQGGAPKLGQLELNQVRTSALGHVEIDVHAAEQIADALIPRILANWAEGR